MKDSKSQNQPIKERAKLSRRSVLGLLGTAGASLVATPLLRGIAYGDPPAETGHLQEGKNRKWAMIIDLRKCDGCESLDSVPECTKACVEGHHTPTSEDGKWEQEWIQLFEKKRPEGGSYFMPTPCFQCENAPCVNVCPVGATYHDKDGIVLINHKRCIGCRLCLAACPYSRRFFFWHEPDNPPEHQLFEYSPEYPIPFYKGTAIKCVFCSHELKQNKLPMCVKGCPMGAIYMGDLNEDLASNGRETVIFSKYVAENDSYRYKEKLGTSPRVFYIPGHGQQFRRGPK